MFISADAELMDKAFLKPPTPEDGIAVPFPVWAGSECEVWADMFKMCAFLQAGRDGEHPLPPNTSVLFAIFVVSSSGGGCSFSTAALRFSPNLVGAVWFERIKPARRQNEKDGNCKKGGVISPKNDRMGNCRTGKRERETDKPTFRGELTPRLRLWKQWILGLEVMNSLKRWERGSLCCLGDWGPLGTAEGEPEEGGGGGG